MAPVLPHYYYLKGAGKKRNRKTTESKDLYHNSISPHSNDTKSDSIITRRLRCPPWITNPSTTCATHNVLINIYEIIDSIYTSSENESTTDSSDSEDEESNLRSPKFESTYYLKGGGKKSRRKTKASRTKNTLATPSEGVDHFILIKIIALIRNEKNAPDDKLEFLLQDLAENGIRHDAVYFHLRFNNGETLDKRTIIKMLQQGRVRFIEPEIHHILNALDDIVVKVKDIDSKTEIEYLELLYSPQNIAVYFNIKKSFDELKFESHKLNLGILLHRTLLEYFMFVIEELKKLLKIDIEQMVSVDTQRAHKSSNRLYRGHEKDQKSWHGFPVQQQASFEAAIAKEILQDTDSKGKLVLSSTLEHYLKRKNMWRNSIFTAAKRAKNRVNIKKLMKPFQDIDEDFPPFVPEDITESLSDLYDKTKEMNDLNKFLAQAATTRLNYQKALEVKKESDIQLDKIKEVKDKLAGELITVITHNGENLDTLRINNAKKRLEEGEKKVATHEAKEMEYSIDDLKLTDNERDFLEPNYRDELTVNDHERDNWNRSSLSPFRKQRARANAYAKSWENTKYDSRPPITPTNTPPPPSSSEDDSDTTSDSLPPLLNISDLEEVEDLPLP